MRRGDRGASDVSRFHVNAAAGSFLVEWRAGRPVLVATDPDALLELAAIVDQANAVRVYRRQLPAPSAVPFVDSARRVALLSSMVAEKQPELEKDEPAAGRWISVRQAATLLGISDQAITKRARAQTLPARKFSGRWLIDSKGI
ncbi:hypothetical protein GCM10023221_36610 [Luteimicrobium xylanilyticum]|nr:helix-turn-helix domain-containing protein [Luteimicrobium xylanilyticum]